MITTCSLYVHYMSTICSLYVHYMFTIYLLLFTIYSLHVYDIFTSEDIRGCSEFSPLPSSGGNALFLGNLPVALHVHYMFTICSLYVYYIFTTGGNALFSGNLPVALILVGMIKLHDNTTMSTVGINDMLIYG